MAAKQLQCDEAARHALLRGVEKLSRAVKSTLGPTRHEGDEAVGVQIVRRALEFPTRQPADNASQEGAVIVQEIKNRSGNERV